MIDPDDLDDPILGEVIDGRYRVAERLGTGGMGFVYLAIHVDLGREMVLKRLRPELVSSERTRERFLREAQAATRIEHPHTIAVSDFGVHPEYGAYYVMERLVGTDIAGALESASMPTSRATMIILQAAEALAAAHASQIIHRDLKPENIFLIERDGHPDFVKVLDFGLARVMDANRKLTETGQVIGTPRYMAPEQCRGERVDARADVYSLGLILYQMLTGVQPYSKLSTYEILGKKMFEHIAAPSALEPPVSLHPEVEAFVMRCLSREPPLRPSSGSEMADELHALRTNLGMPPSPFAHLAEGARNSLPVTSVETVLDLDPPDVFEPTRDGPAPQSASIPVAVAAAPPKARGGGLLIGLGAAGAVLVAGSVIAVGAWLFLRAQEPAPDEVAAIHPPSARVVAPLEEGAPAEEVAANVTVVTEPPGAAVLYEERELGATPLALRVPGDVPEGAVVHVRLEGYESRSVALFPVVPRAHLRLQREAPPEAEAP